MATSVVRSLPSNVILPTIPTTRDARAAHTGLVIFNCFEKIIELNTADAGKPRGKRATNQLMKLLATAMNGKELLLDYLGHTVDKCGRNHSSVGCITSFVPNLM